MQQLNGQALGRRGRIRHKEVIVCCTRLLPIGKCDVLKVVDRVTVKICIYTNFDGHTVDDLQHVTFPDGQKPSAADYDLFVTYSSTAAEGLAVELLHLADGQVYPEAAVVSASDAIVGSDEFAEALAAALENESIQALMPLYDVEMYASVFLYGDRLDDARMLYAYRQRTKAPCRARRRTHPYK